MIVLGARHHFNFWFTDSFGNKHFTRAFFDQIEIITLVTLFDDDVPRFMFTLYNTDKKKS